MASVNRLSSDSIPFCLIKLRWLNGLQPIKVITLYFSPSIDLYRFIQVEAHWSVASSASGPFTSPQFMQPSRFPLKMWRKSDRSLCPRTRQLAASALSLWLSVHHISAPCVIYLIPKGFVTRFCFLGMIRPHCWVGHRIKPKQFWTSSICSSPYIM